MGSRTWDVNICLYLNLKHCDLDHSATMAGHRKSLVGKSVLGVSAIRISESKILPVQEKIILFSKIVTWCFPLLPPAEETVSLINHQIQCHPTYDLVYG